MLFKKLSGQDRDMIDSYINAFAIDDCCSNRTATLEYLLREWDSCKSEYLYRLFGEQMTVSKHVVIQKDLSEIEDSIDIRLFGWHSVGEKFLKAYDKTIERFRARTIYWDERDHYSAEELIKIDADAERYGNLRQLICTSTLAKNVYDGPSFEVPVEGDKPYKVNNGCKASKALGKLASIFHIEGWEEFRVEHSMCLNEKSLSGELTLSIHPLDYMTMSDNDANWCSCMSWTDEGEYRRGTVEMMNSPMVVVAYLKSQDTYSPCYGVRWNSKKWRELFVVTPALIAGIKGYPYWNRDIEYQTIMFLRELAQTNLGWGPYNCEPTMFRPGKVAHFNEFDKDVTFYFNTGAMYCDFYSDHQAIISVNAPPRIDTYYSGASECMACGSLDTDFDGESMLVCCNCDGSYYCYSCGDRHYRDDLCEIDGELFCGYCADDLPVCELCEQSHMERNMRQLHLANDKGIMRGYSINICDDCWDFDKRVAWDKVETFSYRWSTYWYININDCSDDLLGFFGFDNKEEALSFETTGIIEIDKDTGNKE